MFEKLGEPMNNSTILRHLSGEWTSSRQATDREQMLFLRDWPCVCAECKICKLILNWADLLEEEE